MAPAARCRMTRHRMTRREQRSGMASCRPPEWGFAPYSKAHAACVPSAPRAGCSPVLAATVGLGAFHETCPAAPDAAAPGAPRPHL